MRLKRSFLLALTTFLALQISAQEYSTDWGEISRDELEMTSYEKDPDAEAVVIYDLGESKFQREENAFVVMFTRNTRIKILTEAGLDYAEIEIPIYQEQGNYERVTEIKGVTYNMVDGRREITELDPDDSFKEKVNEYWAVQKFVLPNVKPGSVIEYSYQVRTLNKFNLRDWEFQRRIPTVYSEYTVWMVPFYSYTYIMQGANKFDVQRSWEDDGLKQQYGSTEFNYMVHTYGMKDIPAFRDEEYITSYNDYIMKLDFQLSKVYNTNGLGFDYMTTWEDMVDEYLKDPDFGKYVKKSRREFDDVIGEDRLGGLSDSAKISTIVGLVKSNIDWDGFYGKVVDCRPTELIKRKSGSVAEINLFLTGLLQEAGLEAHPVMLSTRSHGKIRLNYPFSHFFNYVIAAVKTEAGYVLADATSPMTADYRIPYRCINDRGLICRKQDPGWLNLGFNQSSDLNYTFKMEVDPAETKVEVGVLATEYQAYNLRTSYGDDHEELLEKLEEDYSNAEISDLAIINADDANEPYGYEYKLSGGTEQLNDKIYVAPFLSVPESENPFKQQKRNLPIDMVYPRLKRFHSEITIPDGYHAEYLPDPIKVLNEDFSMEYIISQDDNQVNIDFYYVFHKPVYPAQSYFTLKFYYNELIKKANDKIVLVKSVKP